MTATPPSNPALENAEYGFLVVKQKDGRYAIASVTDHTERQPSMEDILGALWTLQADLQRQQTVMAILQTMQQLNGGTLPIAGGGQPSQVSPTAKFVKRA